MYPFQKVRYHPANHPKNHVKWLFLGLCLRYLSLILPVLLPAPNGTGRLWTPNAVHLPRVETLRVKLSLELLNEWTANTGEGGRRFIKSHGMNLSYQGVSKMIFPPGLLPETLSQADSIFKAFVSPSDFPASEFARSAAGSE
jgi:hypothetical protein